MFTGIIEESGRLLKIDRSREFWLLQISASLVTRRINIGDSIAVNGVCLTVSDFRSDYFCSEVSVETRECTTIQDWQPGLRLNLERALSLGDRLGGHLVLGHIDCKGKVASLSRRAGNLLLTISFPPEFKRYLVPKGSVAVDGVSLTVADLSDSVFTLALIPHTFGLTNLAQLDINTEVNLEFDILAKYTESLLKAGREQASEISFAYLIERGF